MWLTLTRVYIQTSQFEVFSPLTTKQQRFPLISIGKPEGLVSLETSFLYIWSKITFLYQQSLPRLVNDSSMISSATRKKACNYKTISKQSLVSLLSYQVYQCLCQVTKTCQSAFFFINSQIPLGYIIQLHIIPNLIQRNTYVEPWNLWKQKKHQGKRPLIQNKWIFQTHPLYTPTKYNCILFICLC